MAWSRERLHDKQAGDDRNGKRKVQSGKGHGIILVR
jgi:hypothetical protein